MTKFYAVHAVPTNADDFELVGVLTNQIDVAQFRDDLEKSGKYACVAPQQHLEMNVILEILVRDRLRELAEPIIALAAANHRIR